MNKQIDVNIAQEELNNHLLKEEVLVDGNSILPVSLSPYLISNTKYQHLAYLCQQVINALEKFIQIYVNNKMLQNLYPELTDYNALACKDPGYERWIHLARFDIALTPMGEFKLLETNCDCPGAIQFTPIIKRIFKEFAYESSIDGEIQSQPIDDEQYFLKSLLDLHPSSNNLPSIAFLNSEYRSISSDLNLLEKVGKQLGLNCRQATIQKLQIKNNRICIDNMPIDIAYQKFDAFVDDNNQVKPCIYEKSSNEISAYWHGIMNDKMKVVNSFPSALVAENKRTLAMLLLPELQHYFSEEENNAIKELIPKTYDLCSCSNILIDEIRQNKNQFVIKRAIDTRGRGVWIGKLLKEDQWVNLLKNVCGGPYIAQEYIPHELSKIYNANSKLCSMYSNIAMFIIGGKPSGLLSRASKDIVNNIGKSGCIRPVYVIKAKENLLDDIRY